VDAEHLKTIFKDIHQNPELGFMETRTSDIVARELKALGYEVKEGALADLILVNGNPLENIDLVADPDKNFASS